MNIEATAFCKAWIEKVMNIAFLMEIFLQTVNEIEKTTKDQKIVNPQIKYREEWSIAHSIAEKMEMNIVLVDIRDKTAIIGHINRVSINGPNITTETNR